MGYFELPKGPGIGADLVLEEVKRHPYRDGLDISLFENNWQFRRSKKSGFREIGSAVLTAVSSRPKPAQANAGQTSRGTLCSKVVFMKSVKGSALISANPWPAFALR
jgi:hypothetical protein